MKTLPTLSVLALLSLTSVSSQAILIDFETDSGYAAGNLYDQPGTPGASKWKTPAAQASSGVLSVVSNVGVEGSQAVVAGSHATLTSSTYFLNITDQDLGDLFDASSSKISFSFALKWDALSAYANQGRFYVGGTSADNFAGDVLRVAWMTDGSMIYSVGQSGGNVAFQVAQNASGNTFRATADTFYTIEGVIDYSTKTYTLMINSVEQKNASAGVDLSFVNEGGAQVNANLVLMSLNNNTANYRPWTIDNMQMEAIPEPGSVALAGGALLSFAGMRWLRSRKAGDSAKH